MHEMAIADSLVNHVLEAVRAQDVIRIESVEVEVGVLQLVVPEALQVAFSVVTEGTLAAGATLKLVEVPAAAVCRQCAREFEPAVDDYLCPGCGKADVRIEVGNDIVLRSVVCQTKDSVSVP